MQLPLDIKAVFDEACDIDTAAQTPLSLSIYVDPTAPADLIVAVDSLFTPQMPHARVVGNLLNDALASPFTGDDAAIVVAGLDGRVGEAAANLRRLGVPVMVITTLPELVTEIAQVSGYLIPEGDLLGSLSARDVAVCEPYVLDEDRLELLKKRISSWVLAACREKRLSFALAFPFLRKELALEAVGATAMQNAGVGAVGILPGADLPVMTLNQAKMLLQIAAAYGQPMTSARIKELACIVGAAFIWRSLARQIVGLMPAFGWVLKGALGFMGTEAVGRAAIAYFENEGRAAGLLQAIKE